MTRKSKVRTMKTPEHLWFWIDPTGYPQVAYLKPAEIKSVEYSRLQTEWNRLPEDRSTSSGEAKS